MCQFTFVCAPDCACAVRPSVLSGAHPPDPGLVSCVWFGYSTIHNLQCKRDTVSPGMCIVGVRAYEHHVLKTSHYLLCQMPCKIVMVLFARCAVVACAATQRRRQPGRKESARRCSGAVALSNP